MDDERKRHAWASLASAGDSSAIPQRIERLERAASAAEADRAYWQLDGVMVVNKFVYEAALAAVPCLLQSVLRCTPVARPRVLDLLGQIGGGEPAESEILAGRADIVEQCCRELARGYVVFAHLLETSDKAEEQDLLVDLLGLAGHGDPSLLPSVIFRLQTARAAMPHLRALIDNTLAWLQSADL